MPFQNEVISIDLKTATKGVITSEGYGPSDNMTREDYMLQLHHDEEEMRRALLVFYLVLVSYWCPCTFSYSETKQNVCFW